MAQISGVAGMTFGRDPLVFIMALTKQFKGGMAALNSGIVQGTGQRYWTATAGGDSMTIDLAPGPNAAPESQALAFIANLIRTPNVVVERVTMAAGGAFFSRGAAGTIAAAGAAGGAAASGSAWIGTAATVAGIVIMALPVLVSAAQVIFPMLMEISQGKPGGPVKGNNPPSPAGGATPKAKSLPWPLVILAALPFFL